MKQMAISESSPPGKFLLMSPTLEITITTRCALNDFGWNKMDSLKNLYFSLPDKDIMFFFGDNAMKRS